MRKTKWLIYTVLIGMLPFFARLTIFLISSKLTYIYLLNEIDFVAFGLVLHVSNINELTENYEGKAEWRFANIGVCAFLIAIYSIVLGITYLIELDQKQQIINPLNIKYCSLVLSLVSLSYSYWICGVLTKNTTNAQ